MVERRPNSYRGRMDEITPEAESLATEPASPDAVASPDSAPGAPSATTPVTRLHRSASHRIFGGVAGGLAERFGLDPNLVRVGFVLLTIAWGFGILLYLAMWALIPRTPDEPWVRDAPEHDDAPSSNWVMWALFVALAVVALIAFTTFSSGHTFMHGTHVARDLFVLWVIFLAIMAAIALRAPNRGRSIRRALAIFVLAGLSFVILAAGATLTFLATTGVPLTGGVGARVWYPTALSDVRHSYRTEFGSATIDLRAVSFPAAGYVVSASVAVGSLRIDVPANAVVDLHTHVGAGSVSYGFYGQYGWQSTTFNAIPTGLHGTAIARAPHLTIDAQVGIGKISLSRITAVAPANGPTPPK
jgi:phage shock protein PspC (stress-responsive transcriptional regulator)